MKTNISICFALLLFATAASAQVGIGAADRNTWNVAGMFSTHYILPVDDSEEGAFVVNFSPHILWFPVDGFGAGVDASFFYFSGEFKDVGIAVGPSVAYYLKRPGILSQLLPYSECSFQYLRNSVDPGATETGWSLKLGLGVSPIFGDHIAVPIELGYLRRHLSSEYGEVSYSTSSSSMYLECGIGAFFWKEE